LIFSFNNSYFYLNFIKIFKLIETQNQKLIPKPRIVWASSKQEMYSNQDRGLSSLLVRNRNLKHHLNYDSDLENSKENINSSFENDEDIKLPQNSDQGHYYWIGKDYSNPYKEDFKDIHDHTKDQFERTEGKITILI
jgi:hypothetical protein